jgi:hypothetical protein
MDEKLGDYLSDLLAVLTEIRDELRAIRSVAERLKEDSK